MRLQPLPDDDVIFLSFFTSPTSTRLTQSKSSKWGLDKTCDITDEFADACIDGDFTTCTILIVNIKLKNACLIRLHFGRCGNCSGQDRYSRFSKNIFRVDFKRQISVKHNTILITIHNVKGSIKDVERDVAD